MMSVEFYTSEKNGDFVNIYTLLLINIVMKLTHVMNCIYIHVEFCYVP